MKQPQIVRGKVMRMKRMEADMRRQAVQQPVSSSDVSAADIWLLAFSGKQGRGFIGMDHYMKAEKERHKRERERDKEREGCW